MTDCHTLIISDIHLGARICQAQKVLDLFRMVKFKDLIINGDLFDSDTTHAFNGDHWQVLSELSSIADKHRVMLVGGNHGRELDNLARKIGIRVIDNHAFSVGGRRFLCLHGDEFDVFVKRLPATTGFFTWIFYFIQRFGGGEKQRVSMFLKKFSKIILGIARRQQRLAVKEGIKHQANVVICSHTHIPHVDRQDNVLFVNSGSFCGNPCTYVTIEKSGKVQLREI